MGLEIRQKLSFTPVQAHFDGFHADPQDVGNFAGGQVFELAEHDHLLVFLGQAGDAVFVAVKALLAEEFLLNGRRPGIGHGSFVPYIRLTISSAVRQVQRDQAGE